jgi:hypothetical protein
MKSERAEENYARFSNDPARIDGSVHNTVSARLGTAFNYSAMEPMDAIEIAFANEPHGNMRSVLVADMAAAKALRDQLDQILKEHALIPPVQVAAIPEDEERPGMPTSRHDRFQS